MYQSGFWPKFGHKSVGQPADPRNGNPVVNNFFTPTTSYLFLLLLGNRSCALAMLASLVVALSGCGGVTYNSSSSHTGSGSTPAAATLTMISCGVQSITGAQTTACSVYLSDSATKATTVSLKSNSAALTLPISVVVAAGEKAATFQAVTQAVTKSVSVTISGKANGVTQTDVITLEPVASADPAPVATLSNLSCATQSVTGPATVVCSVSLSAAATTGTVATLSSSSSALKTPGSVNVAAGKTSASFSLTVSAVTAAQKATLTATVGSVNKSEAILLYPAASAPPPIATLSNVSCSSQTLTGPTTETCAVYLSAAATSQTTVMLSSSSSALKTPGSVSVAAGKTSASFSVTASSVSATQKATLTATSGGVKQTDVITLAPAAQAPVATLSGLSCGTQSLTGAQTKSCSVSLSAAASSPMVVALSSSSSALRVPSSVTVPAGGTSATFTATASAVSASQKATLTASAAGVSQSNVITLFPAQSVTPTLTKVACGTQSLIGPTTEACSVYLSAAATSPTVVKLSSNSASLQVPGSITVPTGSASAGFTATASTVTSTLTVILTAATGGVTQTDVIQLESASSSQPAVQHKVQLSWNAPASSAVPVVGYNVYRSAAGASAFSLLNSSVDASTSYTDTAVTSGDSYDYIVKSVDSSGVESPPSNITTVSIP